MAFSSSLISCVFLLLFISFLSEIHAEIPEKLWRDIYEINKLGEFVGIIVPGNAELEATLAQGYGTFEPYADMPTLDAFGKRFHIGYMAKRFAIVVMSGDGLRNAGETAQLLLTLFRIRAVVHYGRAGSANPTELNIGDVAFASQYADCSVWHWEKFGGDNGSSVTVAELTFGDYNQGECKGANSLQTLDFQSESLYSTPEVAEEKFFVRVDKDLYNLAEKLEGLELERCVPVKSGVRSSVCLAEQPKVKRVDSGCSAHIYVNNVDYRDFLRSNLSISTIDKGASAVASVCYTHKKAFLKMASITSLAGGSPPGENDVNVIDNLWFDHYRDMLRRLFSLIPKDDDSNLRSVTGSKMW